MAIDETKLHHQSAREEEYNSQFLEHLLPLANSIESTLRKLTNPQSYEHSSKPISEVPHLYIPVVLNYSFYMVYRAMKNQAILDQHLSTAILCRSLIECMGNVHWLTASGSELELKNRSKILLDQSENVYKFTSNEVDAIPSLSSLGAGSIISRIRACGSGWPIIYGHLSSYSHMDAGYAIHYYLKETLGMRNLCVFFASSAAQQMITDSLELSSEMPKEFTEGIKKDIKEIDKLRKSFIELAKVNSADFESC